MRYRLKKTIRWMQPTKGTGDLGSVTDRWVKDYTTERAVITAPTGQLAAAQYGNALSSIVTLTLPAKSQIGIGYGVWMADEPTVAPWGKVVACRKYPLHVEADVEKEQMR